MTEQGAFYASFPSLGSAQTRVAALFGTRRFLCGGKGMDQPQRPGGRAVCELAWQLLY
ncbi:hypothetical protein GCM10023156_12180 [Novipirellula rosea]|uniref:Uncharacterized protein n=1 Tax=Novipirellula rosea TaxID=1031540 RepID=A0ABP8MG84_9BACT